MGYNPSATSDHDERFVHRLEAFSDIVIGFSLAQVSLNLVLPHRAVELYTRPVGLIAFVMTFAIVATIWLSHNRLFAHYFVRNGWMVFLNFLLLAFTLLAVFMLQVLEHYQGSGSLDAASIGYVTCFIAVYGLLCILYAIGVRVRWPDLDLERRRLGVRSCIRVGAVALGAATGCAAAHLAGLPLIWGLFAILPASLVGRALIWRVTGNIMAP